jgi:hypothetical protein
MKEFGWWKPVWKAAIIGMAGREKAAPSDWVGRAPVAGGLVGRDHGDVNALD